MDVLIFLSWSIPVLVLCYIISALVHELGHAIVTFPYGWKLSCLVIGPVGLKRNDTNKLIFYFEKNLSLWGGMVFAVPIKEAEENIKVFSKSLIAGPIASIIVGIILSVVSFFHFHTIWFPLAWAMLTTAFMMLGMGIVCIIPMKNGFSYTDGKRWLRLRSKGQEKAEEIALFKLMEREQFKKSHESLKMEDFEALLNAKHPSHRYYGYYLLYQFYSNHNDEDNKFKTLETLNEMKKETPKFIIDAYPIL